jgi:formate/nitrite transporter
MVYCSGHAAMNGGAIAAEYLKIGHAKASLGLLQAVLLGVLCNALVCLAVWMAMAGRSVMDKAVAVTFPVTAFVAAGFEHCVANLYLLPMALLLQGSEGHLTVIDVVRNVLPVLAGNIIGGSVLVGLVYHVIYRRKPGPG